MDDITREELQFLKERFLEGSKHWPNLQSILVTWPEGDDLPNLPPELSGQYAIPAPVRGNDGSVWYAATPVGGCELDTPAATRHCGFNEKTIKNLNAKPNRYRSGQAGMLIMRMDADRLWGNPREIGDPDAGLKCGREFHVLARKAQNLVQRLTPPAVSPNAQEWPTAGAIWWRLAVHELAGPDDCPVVMGAECERIADLWFASAKVCAVLLSGLTNESATGEGNGAGYTASRLAAELSVSGDMIHTYAVKAGVKTPDRGGRNYRYPVADAIKICEAIEKESSKRDAVRNAKEFLEILRKPVSNPP